MKAIRFTGLAGALPLLIATAEVTADHQKIDEIIVNSDLAQQKFVTDNETLSSPDVSEQLSLAPGVALNRNGPLTSLPQFRGMSGGRLAVMIDGAPVTSAGPNLMDPPLSYVSPLMVEAVALYRDIAPVSVAQDSFGGAVEVQQWKPAFSEKDWHSSGDLALGYGSIDESQQTGIRFSLASENQRLYLAASAVEGEDAEFADGTIKPSSYQRDQYLLGYGFILGAHQFDFNWLTNNTSDTGTAALPMDISYIDGDIWRASYHWRGEEMSVMAKAFISDSVADVFTS